VKGEWKIEKKNVEETEGDGGGERGGGWGGGGGGRGGATAPYNPPPNTHWICLYALNGL